MIDQAQGLESCLTNVGAVIAGQCGQMGDDGWVGRLRQGLRDRVAHLFIRIFNELQQGLNRLDAANRTQRIDDGPAHRYRHARSGAA